MLLHCLPYLAAMVFFCVSTNYTEPKVKSPVGIFRGKILTSFSGLDYASYRGIPFALPPTGDLRFALPVPYPVIEGIYDASEFGPVCLQNDKGSIIGQEDCLRINIYTPLNSQKTKPDDLKKVYVFIHGGGLVMGTANSYLPGDIVTKGDVIVVTISYRLNWLGFLRGNSTSLPGNLGYYDQLLALQWVKHNIRSFGGDPIDVTLSGESAGSLSVSILSVSPLAKGLFSKVHLMSAVSFPSIDRASNDLLEVAANRFGCKQEVITGNEDSILSCLKQVPGELFVQIFDPELSIRSTSSGNDLLPRPFHELLKDRNYLSDVGFFDRDYLVSILRQDGHIIVNSIFALSDISSLNSVVHNLVVWLRFPEPVVRSVIREYQKLYVDLEDATLAVATDFAFISASSVYLDACSSRQTQGKNAYFMLFDHRPKFVRKQYTLHALDLEYLFDATPGAIINSFYFLHLGNFYEEDFVLKSAFINLVTDFVKRGNPGVILAKRNNNVVWPAYDSRNRSYLNFSPQPFVGQDILGIRREIQEKLVPEKVLEQAVSESLNLNLDS